ncbi:MAG: cell division protein FtsK [Gammaproteobacteria bacterium]|nr:cell division protein FtsK [Gammaproteobacteria bacterium]
MAQAKRHKKFINNNKLTPIKRELIGFLMLVVSLLFFVSIYSHDSSDPNFFSSGIASTVNNYIGVVGAYISHFFFQIFGEFSYIMPFFLFFATLQTFRESKMETSSIKKFLNISLLFLIFTSSCILLHFIGLSSIDESGNINYYGGFMGNYLSNHIGMYMGGFGTLLLSVIVFLYSIVTFFDIPIERISNVIYKNVKYFLYKTKFQIKMSFDKIVLYYKKVKHNENIESSIPHNNTDIQTSVEIPKEKKHVSPREFKEKQQDLFTTGSKSKLPLLEFLIKHETEKTTHDDESLNLMSRLLEDNLANFGIKAVVESVKPGPIVTLFEINPEVGTKVASISKLSKDLARTMSVNSVRVVETISGSSCVGIEIPNEEREIVSLKDIIISKEYEKSKAPLTIALGKDIQGNPICTDINKLPHLLVAGTTGSGKSVAIHSILISLLYKSDPSDLKMLLVDPKMLELSVYEGIPHLYHPVITDMNEAANGLRWCVQEMDRRYRLLSGLSVKNIQSYNKLILDNEQSGKKLEIMSNEGDTIEHHKKLPYIVVVIDEFADLMSVSSIKVQELITRIAQKARAAGIHLILATQRPSVNVITGLIKANISARMALHVSSYVDSKTIIDSMGAEQLLGNGDMLYMGPGTRSLQRIHGAYVSDEEVKKVVEFLKTKNKEDNIESILFDDTETQNTPDIESVEDPLYDEAVKLVRQTGKTSISFIQRKLRIGYNRAARFIETMEEKGILSSPQTNGGNREILKP